MRNRLSRFFCCFLLLFIAGHSVHAQLEIGHLVHKLNTPAPDTQRVMTLDSIGVYYRDINPDTSIQFARKALELAQQAKYSYGEARIRQLLAYLYGHTGNMDDAYTECMRAVQLYKKINSQAGIANTYSQIGANEGKRRNYDTATKYLLLAERICETTHDSVTMVNVYVNLGNISEEYISHEKGLEYFNKALPYTRNRTDARLMVLNNIGIIYGKDGQVEKSLVYFKNVLSESDSTVRSVTTRMNAMVNCTVAYDKLGDHQKAFEYANMVIDLARKYHMPNEEALGLVNRGGMTGNIDSAKGLQDLRDAMAIATAMKSDNLTLEVYRGMIGIYATHKDWQKAFMALDKENTLAAQMFRADKSKQIARLQANYALEKSNIKVEELEVLNHKNENRRNLILGFAICISIVFLVIIFYYRQVIMLNRQLHGQKEELKQLNTVKDKLFSVIGHDLRSPVGSIVSLLSIWETDSLTEEEKTEVISHLKNQTRATLETLDKLLNWGQSQIKGISIFQTTFAPRRVIKESLELLAEQAKQKSITITDNTPAGIQVFADMLQFDFVVRNILSNAIKFTNYNGAIDINAAEDTPEGFTTFKIKDNGVGITPERLKNIFDATGTSTDGTANEKGTNVGLKLCKEYVVSNGGKIWVESVAGQGSTFCFTVKAGTASPAAAAI